MIPLSLENMSLAWTTLHPEDNSISKRIDMYEAKNGKEQVKALQSIYGVTQNVNFACENGDFGMTTVGIFPQRAHPNN